MTEDKLTGWRLWLFWGWLLAGCLAAWVLAIRALSRWWVG
jgi:hypothetical protein